MTHFHSNMMVMEWLAVRVMPIFAAKHHDAQRHAAKDEYAKHHQ
jgi:hypothetical protein